MIAALLLAALAIDLWLVFLATSATGFSRVAGPLHIRLHDPTALLVAAALLIGGLVVLCWRTRARAWSLAAAVLATAAGAVAVTRSAEEMFPLGDIAVIELYVRNALAGRLLVGPYSRFGWHHPGPAYFYVLAPFYALADRTTASLAAGSACVAMAAFALLVWAVARSVSARAAATILVAATAYVWRIPELTASAWNPHIVILPAIALVVTASAAAGGDTLLLPIVVALASIIAQTDAALVPVALAASIAALGGALAARWRADKRAALKAINVSAWIAAALWLLPLAEEMTHTPGNATLLWRFFTNAHTHGQPFSAALGAWGAMLAAPMLGSVPLATGGTLETHHAPLLIALASAQVAGLCAVPALMRRRDAGLARLAVTGVAATLIALWSVTRVEDRIMDHEVFWISGLGALNLGIVFAAIVSYLPPFAAAHARRPGLIPLLNGAAIAAVAAICFGQLERASAGRLPVTATSVVVERLSGSVRQYLEGEGAHKPLVRIGEDTWGLAAGVLLVTARSGIPFAVEESWMPMFPQSFAANGEEDSEVAFGNADEHAQRARIAGSELIATFSNTYIDGLPHRTR